MFDTCKHGQKEKKTLMCYTYITSTTITSVQPTLGLAHCDYFLAVLVKFLAVSVFQVRALNEACCTLHFLRF